MQCEILREGEIKKINWNHKGEDWNGSKYSHYINESPIRINNIILYSVQSVLEFNPEYTFITSSPQELHNFAKLLQMGS